MSQSKANMLPIPASWQTTEANSETEAAAAPPAARALASDFVDTRLIVRSLALGAVLVGSVFGIGRLLPVATNSSAASTHHAVVAASHKKETHPMNLASDRSQVSR